MQYLKFLQILIALGPKLPAILAALQALVDAITAAFPAQAGGLEIVEPTAEELTAESQVGCLVLGTEASQAAFDGSRLRGLFKFLQESGLLTVLIGILTKTGG